MNSIERRSRDKNAPSRLAQAARRLAAAGIEAIQATGTAIEAEPIPPLRPEWISAVDDGSAEIRLALALGSAAASYVNGRSVDPVRHHLLPLDAGTRRSKIKDKPLVNDSRVVMNGRNPIRDLSALVERRLIEASMEGQRESRLVAVRGCSARLDDLSQFITGAVDLETLLGLARAFMAIRWDRCGKDHRCGGTISGGSRCTRS